MTSPTSNFKPLSLPLEPSLLHSILQREIELRKARNRLKDYQPYPKQAEFHEAGATVRERLFLAGADVIPVPVDEQVRHGSNFCQPVCSH